MRLFTVSVIASLVLATNAYSETYFSKLSDLFAASTAPDLAADFSESQVWAGKCVDGRYPDNLLGGVLSTYTSGDPILGPSYKMIVNMSDVENRYVDIDRDAAVQLSQNMMNQGEFFSTVTTEYGLDSTPQHWFQYRRLNATGQPIDGINFNIRKNLDAEGSPFYMVAYHCPFSYCGGNIAFNEIGYLCYYYQEKLIDRTVE